MKRSLGIKFIPQSTNFSEMEEWQVEAIEDKREESTLELTILEMLYNLPSDKQRCILLIELLRQLGYNIDYESGAKALHVELRWFMRLKAKMKNVLQGIAI